MMRRGEIGDGNVDPQRDGGEFEPVKLMNYIRGQFEDAYTKERHEDQRGETALHGSFYQVIPLPTDVQIPRGSTRIIMKEPHPNDEPGNFSELYAVHTRGEDGHEVHDDSGLFADQYIYRSYTNGVPGALWLIDEMGVHSLPVDSRFDAIRGFEYELENVIEDYDRASSVLDILTGSNIVAVTDPQN